MCIVCALMQSKMSIMCPANVDQLLSHLQMHAGKSLETSCGVINSPIDKWEGEKKHRYLFLLVKIHLNPTKCFLLSLLRLNIWLWDSISSSCSLCCFIFTPSLILIYILSWTGSVWGWIVHNYSSSVPSLILFSLIHIDTLRCLQQCCLPLCALRFNVIMKHRAVSPCAILQRISRSSQLECAS